LAPVYLSREINGKKLTFSKRCRRLFQGGHFTLGKKAEVGDVQLLTRHSLILIHNAMQLHQSCGKHHKQTNKSTTTTNNNWPSFSLKKWWKTGFSQ